MRYLILDEIPIPGLSGETAGKVGVAESIEEAQEFRLDYIESLGITKKEQKYIIIKEA